MMPRIVASLALGVASVFAAPAQPAIKPTTPLCLVGAAVFYPVFLGGVLLGNPTSLPSAAPGYWVGGDQSRGWLSGCGLSTS
jgi:hypothetical protein